MTLQAATLVLAFGSISSAHAADLYLQNFETAGAGYTADEFIATGLVDFFTRTDGTTIDSSVRYTGSDGYFFAGQDVDTGGFAPAFLTSDAFSIAGAAMLQFSVDLAEDDLDSGLAQSWDLGDSVRFEYRVDGGAWQEIFTVSGTGSNTAARLNGTEIPSTFTNFSADLTGVTGESMMIRLVWNLDANGEDLAVDNIRVTAQTVAAVPLPPAAFAGLAMLGVMGVARKLRR